MLVLSGGGNDLDVLFILFMLICMIGVLGNEGGGLFFFFFGGMYCIFFLEKIFILN